MVEYLSGEAESATREGRAASEMSQNTLISGIPYNDTMGFLVPSKLGLVELKSDDTMRFVEFSCKMKLHLINLCLQARIDFYNQQKEEQKANRAKYREKVRRQKPDNAVRKNLGKENTGEKERQKQQTKHLDECQSPRKNSKLQRKVSSLYFKGFSKNALILIFRLNLQILV